MEFGCESYLAEHAEKFVEELRQWLAIASISSRGENRQDVAKAARWVHDKLSAIGCPQVETITTAGHPLVFGQWRVDDARPTLLIYGHYDVQPVDPLNEWLTPPFEPAIRDDNIYARGASDDKGQVMLVLAALEAWARSAGGPPVNLVVLIEGEEEAGGSAIETFVRENPQRLGCDAVLICDTHMVRADQPSLVVGLRGIVYAEIGVSGAVTDLHSGSYGGVAPNPLHALCVVLSRIKGEDGVIDIPGLQAQGPEVSEEERRFWREDPLGIESALKHEMGVEELVGDVKYPPLERLGNQPTFEIHGIRGGYTGEGAKTVIPAEALAKVSLRLPAHLDPEQVFGALEAAARSKLPAGHRMRITCMHGGRGLAVRVDNPFVRAAAEALAEVYGRQPVFMREGGSIPVAALFDEVLGAPVILMGFGLPDDGIHAPNEKMSLQQFRLGMRTVADYLGRIEKIGVER